MKRNTYKTNEIIEQINKISNKESLEYIYMDNIEENNINLEQVFEDRFLITHNKDEELVMIDNNSDVNKNTLLSFVPEVDLMILNDQMEISTSVLEQMISRHTIIIKIFDRIYYIEDPLKNEMYITTENESLKIMNNGIYTKISQDTTQIR
ncbi:MAG: hypothetical protein BZ133_01470 [Methanosphaera sp. SHI613]|jgi:hypothetical protein|nr:MAG: hypothetical protein BZ133_01470 [Methanosphaera sp. SHI613]